MKLRAIAAILAFAATPALADDTASYQQEARAVAASFMKQLGGELQKEMKANGPASAVGVCKTLAPEISSKLSREHGWQVTRVSLKVRDPLLGTPDVWEQKSLQDFDKRSAGGEKPETLEIAEIVDEPAGKYFRYMKAIPVAPVCLSCHGPAEKIAPEVKASLSKDFPHDMATGYSESQIRGAITIKRPL